MEFLTTCTTNALALADVETIEFAAFSLTRTAAASREWSPSQDVRAVEARLRHAAHWVTQDATRPWLWLFKPVSPDASEHAAHEPPPVEGYRLQRELSGRVKAAELARPPLRATHASTSGPTTATPSPASSSSATRLPPSHSQPHAADPPPPDCLTLYHLLISSVIGLVSYTLVKDCAVVALNYCTFLSRSSTLNTPQNPFENTSPDLHWLTSIGAHWTSSGTFLLSTITRPHNDIFCLDRVEHAIEQEQLLGSVIRVAPNGLLATIVAFDYPLAAGAADAPIRQKKRSRTSSLEQSIAKWKLNVTRWLGWRGFALPDLEKHSSWVRIRVHHPASGLSSPTTPFSHDSHFIWPRALCFLYDCNRHAGAGDVLSTTMSNLRTSLLKWFETAESPGFRDPLDAAQEWALGKADRDKLLETQRRAKLAGEDAIRRKEEQAALCPSSPRNIRNAISCDLQTGGAVYPTPPDAIVAPGTVSHQGDTANASGTASNVILAPGGSYPAINLMAPQEQGQTEMPRPLSSTIGPPSNDPFQPSGGNDDLFGDTEEQGYEGDNINEEDFDFFDAPDDEDEDMLNAPPETSDVKQGPTKEVEPLELNDASDSQNKSNHSDPSAALENALGTSTLPRPSEIAGGNRAKAPAQEGVHTNTPTNTMDPESRQFTEEGKPKLAEAIPLSPRKMAQILRPAPVNETISSEERERIPEFSRDRAFDPLQFSRKISLTDAKYHDGRFAIGRNNATNIERRTSMKRNSEPKILQDSPLMTKLCYALGATSTTRIPEISALAPAVSDNDSDTSSETSEASEDDSEDEKDASPLVLPSGLSMPAKRKLPTDGNATPMSVTSFADSWGGDLHDDLQGLQLDEAFLTFLEPSSWDYSLVFPPSPAERSALGATINMPAFLPPPMQIPDTPVSQSDLSLEIPEEKSYSGKDSIIVAQIVTDQIVSATLDILNEDAMSKANPDPHVSSETRWHVAIKSLFPGASECTVSALAAVNDVFPEFHGHGKGQQRPPPRKRHENTAPGSQIFQLKPPCFRVRRADNLWDLLPPAIAFWEHLGLSPASPPKNVIAFCIYPHNESLRPYLKEFLLNIQLAYDSCKLGSHGLVETMAEFEGGLVPCKLTNPLSEQHAFAALKETCVQLGKVLAMQYAKIQDQQEGKIDAFVMYIVDPFGDPSALWDLCQSFWALFQAYGQGSPGRPDASQKPDLVLQVVPMKYIASFDAPVILDPSTYINLAREVYDRCPPSAPSGDKSCLSIYNAPAFQLEETIPRSIPFKLLSEPPQDLIRENSYMHLGYAISLDGMWVTAAWTDTCGKSQAVVSYHLGTRVFGEIAKEIWQTTIEILQSRRIHWRICIAKAGVMERDELETWVLLISYPAQLNLFVTLLSVDTQPPFKFTPTMPPTTATASTPISTPQPGVSPDPNAGLTPAATPSAESSLDPSLDPDARLIDVTDETWGVTLAHRLHNTHSTSHFSPALISGLLVKRGQTLATSHSFSRPIPDPLPGPIVIAVNILWIGAVGSIRTASPFSPADSISSLSSAASASASASASPSPSSYSSAPHQSPQQTSPLSADANGPRNTNSLMWTPTTQTRSTAENLLKEILGQFRALGLLARLRGMRGTKHGSVPWHLVAAERGVVGLDKVVVGGVR